MITFDDLEQYIDIEQEHLSLPHFADALAIQTIISLITCGGRYRGEETDLRPEHLERFFPQALAYARQTRRFEAHWQRLAQFLPNVRAAWQHGQEIFAADLQRAQGNPEDLGYLEMIDFAEDCYAYGSARKYYPHNGALHAWFINGYLLAWNTHFVEEDEAPG